jgi:hypothetical protein
VRTVPPLGGSGGKVGRKRCVEIDSGLLQCDSLSVCLSVSLSLSLSLSIYIYIYYIIDTYVQRETDSERKSER